MILKTEILTEEVYKNHESSILVDSIGFDPLINSLRKKGAKEELASVGGALIMSNELTNYRLYPDGVNMIDTVDKFKRPSISCLYDWSSELDLNVSIMNDILALFFMADSIRGQIYFYLNHDDLKVIKHVDYEYNLTNDFRKRPPYILLKFDGEICEVIVNTAEVKGSSYWKKHKKLLKTLVELISNLPEKFDFLREGSSTTCEYSGATFFECQIPLKDNKNQVLEEILGLITYFETDFRSFRLKVNFALNLDLWKNEASFEDYLHRLGKFPEGIEFWCLGNDPIMLLSSLELFDLRNDLPKYPSLQYENKHIPIGIIKFEEKDICFYKVFKKSGIFIIAYPLEGKLTRRSKVIPKIEEFIGTTMELVSEKEFGKL